MMEERAFKQQYIQIPEQIAFQNLMSVKQEPFQFILMPDLERSLWHLGKERTSFKHTSFQWPFLLILAQWKIQKFVYTCMMEYLD